MWDQMGSSGPLWLDQRESRKELCLILYHHQRAFSFHDQPYRTTSHRLMILSKGKESLNQKSHSSELHGTRKRPLWPRHLVTMCGTSPQGNRRLVGEGSVGPICCVTGNLGASVTRMVHTSFSDSQTGGLAGSHLRLAGFGWFS